MRCARPLGSGNLRAMNNLPPSVQQVVDSTPLTRVRSGLRTVLEVTAYPDGHANIAVGSLHTRERGAMVYTRVKSLPLNHREELERVLTHVLDRLFDRTAHDS
jgi:hypothetical protein